MHGLSLNSRMILDATLWCHCLCVHRLPEGQSSNWAMTCSSFKLFWVSGSETHSKISSSQDPCAQHSGAKHPCLSIGMCVIIRAVYWRRPGLYAVPCVVAAQEWQQSQSCVHPQRPLSVDTKQSLCRQSTSLLWML